MWIKMEEKELKKRLPSLKDDIYFSVKLNCFIFKADDVVNHCVDKKKMKELS